MRFERKKDVATYRVAEEERLGDFAQAPRSPAGMYPREIYGNTYIRDNEGHRHRNLGTRHTLVSGVQASAVPISNPLKFTKTSAFPSFLSLLS